jgi:hypothetical protein
MFLADRSTAPTGDNVLLFKRSSLPQTRMSITRSGRNSLGLSEIFLFYYYRHDTFEVPTEATFLILLREICLYIEDKPLLVFQVTPSEPPLTRLHY